MTTQNNTEIFESLAVLSISELRELIIEASHLLIEKEDSDKQKTVIKSVIVSLSQSIGVGVNFH